MSHADPRTGRGKATPLAASLGFALATLSLASGAQAAQFVPLGDLPGGAFDSAAWGVSSNGRYVVGDGDVDTGAQGFRYDVYTGQMMPLEILPLPTTDQPYTFTEGRAKAVSDDGIAVGWVNRVSETGGDADFAGARWDDAGALTAYPSTSATGLGGGIADVTPDGSVGVGFTEFASDPVHIEFPEALGFWDASFWTPEGGFESGYSFGPALFDRSGIATSISSDGAAFAGAWGLTSAWPYTAIRYSAADGVTDLGTLANGYVPASAYDPFFLPQNRYSTDVRSEAQGISPDGKRLVGWTATVDGAGQPNGYEAFLWQDDGNGMIGLGDLGAGEDESSAAYAISSTGVVVGTADRGSERASRSFEAFVYDPVHGMISLEDMLTGLGVDLGGYHLITAYDISPDGNYIVGQAIDPDGNPEAYFVSLPEPEIGGRLLLAVVAWLATGSRRARRQALREAA